MPAEPQAPRKLVLRFSTVSCRHTQGRRDQDRAASERGDGAHGRGGLRRFPRVITLHQEVIQLDAQVCFRPRKCRPCCPPSQRKKKAPVVLSRQVHVGRRPPVMLRRKNSAIRARGGFSRQAPSATARPQSNTNKLHTHAFKPIHHSHEQLVCAKRASACWVCGPQGKLCR